MRRTVRRALLVASVTGMIGCATSRPPAAPRPAPAVQVKASTPAPAEAPAPKPAEAPAPKPVVVAPPPPPPAACGAPRPELEHPPAAQVEDPKGVMAPFYEAMARTLMAEEGAITRIGHWSDSTLAADGVSSYVRRRLQLAYGDAGHGYVLPNREIPHYGHRDIQRWSGGRWLNIPLVGGKTHDARYGLGGWVSIGRKGGWFTLRTATKRSPVGLAMSKLHVYHLEGPQLGELTVQLNGEPFALISTDAPERRDAMATVTFPDGPHRISLRVHTSNRVRLYGVAVERDGPGFIYDSFGILGALARRFKRVDPAHWKAHLGFRPHDLLLIQFGGNSIQDGGLSYTKYREDFRRLVRLFRDGRPETACMVLSPHDHGRRIRGGRIDTAPRMFKLMPIQREVAIEEGCAWFSVFDAMGGNGSMGRYYRKGMASSDLRHLRLKGAKAIANHLVDALEHGFNAHLDTLDCPEAAEDPGAPVPVDRL